MNKKAIFQCFLASLLLINPVLDARDSELLYINERPSSPLSNDQKDHVNFFIHTLSETPHLPTKETTIKEYLHTFENYDSTTSTVYLEDGSGWKIDYWYSSIPKNWIQGNQIKIKYDHSKSVYELINLDTPSSARGAFARSPFIDRVETIARIPVGTNNPDSWKTLHLKSGWIFYLSDPDILRLEGWEIKDEIFVLHAADGYYDLWNLDKGRIIFNFTLIGNERVQNFEKIEFSEVLSLNEHLDAQVLAQPEATEAVSTAIINYSAGLTDPQKPIAAFLFIGPTGVGKTELAKVLAKELYHSNNHLIRFDMAHFGQAFNMTRLIGSAPGYVNYEEGGQLTEALKAQPQSIVLLDEFEKAHPSIQKLFLPVLDEGYIVGSNNIELSCKETIFVMTSNLCSTEISTLFKKGVSPEDVLSTIEPKLIDTLSPEVYNRLQPVLFRPLGKEVMGDLVDLQLDFLIKRMEKTKQLKLHVDQSVKEYLVLKGFHPDLGARPLKKLIENTLVKNIAKAIISDNIPEGSEISIFYLKAKGTWSVNWSK